MINAQTIAKLPSVLRPVTEEQQANAAVALILRPADEDYQVLLVKRVQNPKDPWSGQMALPGGKREASDTNLKATVIRETFEETGLHIENAQFLGVTTSVYSKPVVGFCILPFVVVLSQPQEIKLSTSELDSFMWVPIRKLQQSKATAQVRVDKVPAFVFENVVVWGITHQILSDFLEAAEKAANQ